MGGDRQDLQSCVWAGPRRARKLATAAAYGGGGLGAATAGFVGVLVAEAQWARRAIGLPTTDPHEADGVYAPEAGSAPAGPPIRYAMLGDSSAAGLGADHPLHTPGSLIAQGLAALTGRPVELRSAAVVGAVSSDLDAQVEGLSEWAPEVATIMIGANDVTHVVLPAVAVRHLDQAVRRLHGLGCQVVVGTAPDLGTIRPVAHPLRWVGRTWSRQLAAAQTMAVVEAGGRTVSLGDLLGTEFDAKAEALFSADRFHPSSEGYAASPRCCCPASRRRWARRCPSTGPSRRPPPAESCRPRTAGVGCCRWPRPPRPPPTPPAPRCPAPAWPGRTGARAAAGSRCSGARPP